MAQRTVALCNGKYIGIETIYTVINGQQINIPDKLKDLRDKSQSNESTILARVLQYLIANSFDLDKKVNSGLLLVSSTVLIGTRDSI